MELLDSIDINEKYLLEKYPKILDLLLIDNSTKKNILWATDSYKNKDFRFHDNMSPFIIGENNFIKPRSQKSKTEQTKRSKDNAEVFTPSWMCNKQNNLIDAIWFNRNNVFNKETTDSWKTNYNKVQFTCEKTWIDYVKEIRLEITCGEAPYLVSRYDTVTGRKINIKDRIGLLDRKLRIVNENTSSKEEWIKYSIEAVKSIYGYEWQGDNLLLARENVLFSYFEYYCDRFIELPPEDLMLEIATIVSWNLWQMDGIKGVIPGSCQADKRLKINLFGEEEIQECGCLGCAKDDMYSHNGIYAKIMNWETNKEERFVDQIKEAINDELQYK